MSDKVRSFEDLIAWQKARVLVRDIYRSTAQAVWLADRSLAYQMRSAAVSAMSNLAEGFERRTSREFLQFICIARSSCAALRSQLYVAADTGQMSVEEFRVLLAKADELSRILGALRAVIEKRCC